MYRWAACVNMPLPTLLSSAAQPADQLGPRTAGLSPPEQWIPVRPDGTTKPIAPGEEVYWQSAQTNKFCRVVEVSGQSRVQCDQDSPEAAARMVYTGARCSGRSGMCTPTCCTSKC